MMGRTFGKRSAIRAATAAIFIWRTVQEIDYTIDTNYFSVVRLVGIILSRRSCKWRVVVGNPIAVGRGECANIASRSC